MCENATKIVLHVLARNEYSFYMRENATNTVFTCAKTQRKPWLHFLARNENRDYIFERATNTVFACVITQHIPS